MRQALHIFRKDVRYLRNEICLILTFTGIFAFMSSGWIELLMILAAAYVIVRVVHAETIPGDNQFWLTRPYRWRSLLGAKILFIVLFVNLPICLAQLGIVLAKGFPLGDVLAGLLWTQALLILLLTLPIAALAAITSGIMPFIFCTFVLVAIYFFAGNWLVRLESPWPASVEWIRDSLAAVVIAALALTVLYAQYRGRRTAFSRTLAAGVTTVGALLYWYMPLSMAMAVQTGISTPPDFASNLAARLPETPGRSFEPRKSGIVGVQLPITVTGVPEEISLGIDSIPLVIELAGGETSNAALRRPANAARQTRDAGAVTFHTTLLLDPPVFNRAAEKPVTLRASVYFTAFGNARSRTIPLQQKPANVMDGLQCYEAAFDTLNCRSAFRWPASMVYSSFGTGLDPIFQMISYSPFPGSLQLNPIESHWGLGAPASARDVTIVLKEPVAHFRRDFEFRGVHLADFALAWGRER